MNKEIITITSTEIRNHFGKYLQFVMDGGEVVITRNGQEAGRLISRLAAAASLTDSLTGILSGDIDPDQARDERLKEKYLAKLDRAFDQLYSGKGQEHELIED